LELNNSNYAILIPIVITIGNRGVLPKSEKQKSANFFVLLEKFSEKPPKTF